MNAAQTCELGPFTVGRGRPLLLIAGPCVIESLDHCRMLAEKIAAAAARYQMPYVFKASFDKANRSSIRSPRGRGLEEGLRILETVKRETGLPVLSDIHEPGQAAPAAQVLDCLQIPAFLCRQTDLLVACGGTGKCVNIKKGQFLSPDKIGLAVQKVRESGNPRVLVTERGTTFGYERLVNDMTGLAVMRTFAPVVFDATHSVQHPGAAGDKTGGDRESIPLLARAAVASGIDGLFLEVHNDPPRAHSDPATVWPLERLDEVLAPCAAIRAALADEVR